MFLYEKILLYLQNRLSIMDIIAPWTPIGNNICITKTVKIRNRQ